jgi:hypothetical protein
MGDRNHIRSRQHLPDVSNLLYHSILFEQNLLSFSHSHLHVSHLLFIVCPLALSARL